MCFSFSGKWCITDDFTNLRMYLYLQRRYEHIFAEKWCLFEKAYDNKGGAALSDASSGGAALSGASSPLSSCSNLLSGIENKSAVQV